MIVEPEYDVRVLIAVVDEPPEVAGVRPAQEDVRELRDALLRIREALPLDAVAMHPAVDHGEEVRIRERVPYQRIALHVALEIQHPAQDGHPADGW